MANENSTLKELLTLDLLMGAKNEYDEGTALHRFHDTLSKYKFGEYVVEEKKEFYWDAKHFRFDGIGIFNTLSEEKKKNILKFMSAHYLGESSYIEKMGFGFNAKMILLSHSVEEKTLYSIFAADEAKHLQSIKRYINEVPTAGYQENPFLALIGTAIQIADRDSLVLFIQVLLEGFGMLHYKSLQEGCLSPSFKNELADLLKDEAFHHGSGSLLANQNTYHPKKEIIGDLLPQMIMMLHGWVHPYLSAVSITTEGMTLSQKITMLNEMNYEAQTNEKLSQMKRLITNSQTKPFIDALEKNGIFKSISTQDCAKLHQP